MRRTKKIVASVLVCGALLLSACATAHEVHHKYLMRGSIVGKKDNRVSLCIGTKDGAKKDQVLSVYRIESVGNPSKQPFAHRKVIVGKVKIEKIVDEHFAVASVVSGTAEVNQIVELDN